MDCRQLRQGCHAEIAIGVYSSPSKAARRTRQRDLLQANIAEQHRLMIIAQQAEQAQQLSAAAQGGVRPALLQGDLEFSG